MTTAEAINDAFEGASRAVALDPAKLGPAWLPNGYYTLTFPCGSHRTLRVYTQQKGTLAGRRIVSLLIGPDNTDDYEDLAFVGPDGVQVWKRFAGRKPAEYAALLWDLARGDAIDGHSVQLSKRCLACNRPLTTPESLTLGYGPNCAERLGLK